jgi:hypothetical protein
MIKDTSYNTVRYGRVPSFSGYEVVGAPGDRILRVGHGPTGGPDFVRLPGCIIEHSESALGTKEFEARLGRVRWACGELEYADYIATQF